MSEVSISTNTQVFQERLYEPPSFSRKGSRPKTQCASVLQKKVFAHSRVPPRPPYNLSTANALVINLPILESLSQFINMEKFVVSFANLVLTQYGTTEKIE